MRIDLHADVAGSFGRWRLGDDAALLPHLTSANVACGFHAGDARTIHETVRACAGLGVVTAPSLERLAQCRPGERVTLRPLTRRSPGRRAGAPS